LPNESEKWAKLNLVDLAGSEKLSKSWISETQIEETKQINLSLTCLGKVINQLSTGSEFVSYWDSKLTWIL